MPDSPNGSAAREAALDQVRAAIANPALLRMFDYWRARLRDGRLPSRGDIDPLDVPFIMGNLILVDAERPDGAGRGRWRFRYRLAGSRLTQRYGFDPTGRYVDEHPDPNFRPILQAAYESVAVSALPSAYFRNEVIDGRVRVYDVLILPLSSDGANVTMIMSMMAFRD